MALPVPDTSTQTIHTPTIRPLRRVEYDQLVALGVFGNERLELLEGQLVAMSPIGAPHASAVQKLNNLLLPALLGRATVRIQNPIAALDTSEPEPDVAVVPLGDYDCEHPTEAYLVIEVADSSLAQDRGLKQRLYARAGVHEYWIVNIKERCLEVYREPNHDGYAHSQRIAHGDGISPQHFADVRVDVAAILR